MTSHPDTHALAGVDEYQRLVTLLGERRFEEAQVRARVLLESGEAGIAVRAKTHNLICWTFIEGLKRPTPEAVLHGEEAVRLARDLAERSLMAEALCNLASAYHQVGDYEHSRQTYENLLSLLAGQSGVLAWGVIIAHEGLAHLDLGSGKPEQALARLEAAEALCRDEESRFLLADLYRRRALALLDLDRAEEAAQVLAQIDQQNFATGPRSLWWKTHFSFTLARIELARGHWGSARPLIVNAIALSRELADLPVLAECMCLLALVDQAECKKEALKRARTALAYAIHSGRRDVVDEVRARLKGLLATET